MKTIINIGIWIDFMSASLNMKYYLRKINSAGFQKAMSSCDVAGKRSCDGNVRYAAMMYSVIVLCLDPISGEILAFSVIRVEMLSH